MAELKVWTVEEANAALSRVRPVVLTLRDAAGRYREARDGVAALEHREGEAVREEGHPDHDRLVVLLEEATRARLQVETALRELDELGVEPKDPQLGLVDFPTLRGRDVVYLCWKLGEDEITHWHTVAAGYPGREPLDDLVRAAGR